MLNGQLSVEGRIEIIKEMKGDEGTACVLQKHGRSRR
jgi:hypothetical protein